MSPTNRLLERRYLAHPVEIRASGSGSNAIGGYAAMFNKFSQNLGGYVEQVDPGAFRDLTGSSDVVCLFNHGADQIVGRTGVNLTLTVDDEGLDYECQTFADDPTAVALVAKIRNRLVQQSSFAFYTLEDDWSLTPQGFPLRTLLRAQLVDVSPVTSPAYMDTTTGLRSLAECRGLDFAAVLAAAGRDELRGLMEKREEQAPAAPGPTPRPRIRRIQ